MLQSEILIQAEVSLRTSFLVWYLFKVLLYVVHVYSGSCLGKLEWLVLRP